MEFIPRLLQPLVTQALGESRAVCVLGPRQAGKSTLVHAIVEGEFPGAYVSLDDTPTLDAARNDPAGFIARAPLAIDEVQRAPELLLAIKRAVDARPDRGQFLLTGSANIMTLARVADALPGRVDYLTLWPLSQQELAAKARPGGDAVETRPDFAERWLRGEVSQITGAPIGRAAYAGRVSAGGFPESVSSASARRIRFFNGYVDTILGRGLEDVASVRNVEAVGRLLRLLAARSGALANAAALSAELSIDAKTAASYLHMLEQLFLVIRLPAWHVNLGHRVVKSAKVHLADTGLLCALLGFDSERLVQDAGVGGAAFETFVVTEIARSLAYSASGPLLRLYHYRDQRGVEVDLVIEHADGDVVAVEVKSSATPRAADAAGLRFLRDKLGARFRAGILLHVGPDSQRFGDRIHAVPLAALLDAE